MLIRELAIVVLICGASAAPRPRRYCTKNVPKTYQTRTKHVPAVPMVPRKSPFNTIPNQSQFQCLSHPCVFFRMIPLFFASMHVLSHEFNSRCTHLHPCIHAHTFVVHMSVVQHSDLCVSCVAVHAHARGAVCCLAAVPASKAAHAQPAELLVCVAVLLMLLVPV